MVNPQQIKSSASDKEPYSRGLTKIIGGLSNFFDKNAQGNITEGVIAEICRMIGVSENDTFIVKRGIISDHRENTIRVFSALGAKKKLNDHSIQRLEQDHLIARIDKAFVNESDVFEDEYAIIFTSYQYCRMALYLPKAIRSASAEYIYLKEILDGVARAQLHAEKINELYSYAYLDGLTQLPNRHDFIRYLNQPDFEHTTYGITVALVDIEHFSDVNDSLGQEVGNALLKAIAKRLSARIDESCRVARIGADVFGIVGASSTLSIPFLESIFERPFRAANNTLNINVAIGLCLIDGELNNGIDILKRCNLALNEAKRSFPAKAVWYNQELEIATVWRLELIRKLRTAFEMNELELWYQPKFTLATKQTYGFEALLRWRQSDGSFVQPDTFIPLAEYSGIIIEIGKWVLEESVKMVANFTDKKYQIAVNVSISQLRQKGFVADLKQLLEKYAVDPKYIEIEITESVLMKDTDYSLNTLEQLKALGVSIAIDDFGTGFSSLQYLQKMPIDRLKIDRAFVKDSHNDKSKIVTEMIIQLADKFGMSTVAEGIEHQEQLQMLTSLGCTEGQGFMFGCPMERFDVRDFLANENARR